MNKVASFVSGTFILVGIYLFLTNYRGATAIIGQAGSTYAQGVKTLQGRS